MANIGVLNVGGCSGVTKKTRPRVTIGVARYGLPSTSLYTLHLLADNGDIKQQTDKQTKSWRPA